MKASWLRLVDRDFGLTISAGAIAKTLARAGSELAAAELIATTVRASTIVASPDRCAISSTAQCRRSGSPTAASHKSALAGNAGFSRDNCTATPSLVRRLRCFRTWHHAARISAAFRLLMLRLCRTEPHGMRSRAFSV